MFLIGKLDLLVELYCSFSLRNLSVFSVLMILNLCQWRIWMMNGTWLDYHRRGDVLWKAHLLSVLSIDDPVGFGRRRDCGHYQ